MGTFGIGSTGLGSGFDVQALVDQIIFAERSPVRLLEMQQTQFNAQAAALTGLQTKLAALKDKIAAWKDPLGAFAAKAVTSSHEAVGKATADGSAIMASHSVVVSSLATTSSYYSAALAGSGATFAAGSFDLAIGGAAPTTIGLSFTKAVAGANAALTVDGIPISSTSNTVSGAVAGLTLNLLGAAPGTMVSISVAPDTKKARAAVDEFVSADNAVLNEINAQFTLSGASKSAGALAGDAGVRWLQQSLLADGVYSFAGSNGFGSLAALGIDLLNDGTLRVEATKLDAALESNFSDTQNFFQAAGTGFAVMFSADLAQVADSSTGVLAVSLTGVRQSQTSLTDPIRGFDDRLVLRRQSLIEHLSRVNAQLQQLPVILQQINQQLASFP